MRPLLYIIRKSVKNKLLELKRKPAQLIVYIFFFGMITLSTFSNGKGSTGGITPVIYGAAATCLILLFTVPDLLTSLNKGSTFFRGADVNLVFTAPLSPQNVLVYGFLKQMYTIAISLIFILFQIPNLMRFGNIKLSGIFIIVLAFFMLIFANSIIKVLLYSIISKKEVYRRRANNAFKFLGVFFVGIYFIQLFNLRSPGTAIMSMINSNIIKFIPIYGWIREILMAAINGANFYTLIYAILTLAVMAVLIYSLYSMETDYYEDVLQATEKREEAFTTIRNRGKGAYKFNAITLGKVKKIEYKHKGQGASAIFYRQVLEAKKTGFGFISMMTISYAVIGVSAGLFMPAEIRDLRVVLVIGAYILLIFSMAGRWQAEMSRPYIYLIPASSVEKVIFSTLMDNIKNLLDGSVLFIIPGILFRTDPIIVILCILAYCSFGSIMIYGGLLTKRFLGNAENVVMSAMVRMLLMLLIVLPGSALFIFLSFVFNNYSGYLAFIIYNLIFSGIIILLSKGIFEKIELA